MKINELGSETCKKADNSFLWNHTTYLSKFTPLQY